MEGVQITEQERELIRKGLLIDALQKQKDTSYFTFNQLDRKLLEERALKFSAKKFLQSFRKPGHISVVELQEKISQLEKEKDENLEKFSKTMEFAHQQLNKVKRERDQFLEAAANLEKMGDEYKRRYEKTRDDKIQLIALFAQHEKFYNDLQQKYELVKGENELFQDERKALLQKNEMLRVFNNQLMNKLSTTAPIRQLK